MSSCILYVRAIRAKRSRRLNDSETNGRRSFKWHNKTLLKLPLDMPWWFGSWRSNDSGKTAKNKARNIQIIALSICMYDVILDRYWNSSYLSCSAEYVIRASIWAQGFSLVGAQSAGKPACHKTQWEHNNNTYQLLMIEVSQRMVVAPNIYSHDSSQLVSKLSRILDLLCVKSSVNKYQSIDCGYI